MAEVAALQLPGPLAIVPGAHVPPQADAPWFRSLLEVLRLRFPGPAVARIVEALQGAWASVHGWWSGPPPAAAPEMNKKKKNKNKNKKKKKKKNKKHVLPVPPAAAPEMNKKNKNKNKNKKRRRVIPAPPAPDDPQPSQPAPVPVIVDGETVPAEIVEGYKRYCRIARSSPATITVCHLCIFEVELHPNGIVRTNDMIAHCSQHPTVAVRCGRFGCAAKVPPGRDLRWHTYFCHDLPADWWRRP